MTKYKCIVEYEYPVDHKPPVKAEIVLHGDRVITDRIVPYEERPHGEWIETSNIWETEDLSGWGYWKECSSCHCQEKRRTAFCPNCGSDNRKRGDRNEY